MQSREETSERTDEKEEGEQHQRDVPEVTVRCGALQRTSWWEGSKAKNKEEAPGLENSTQVLSLLASSRNKTTRHNEKNKTKHGNININVNHPKLDLGTGLILWFLEKNKKQRTVL